MLRRSIQLRNPYVDPVNAIQVELLRRFRGGDDHARLPLMRSIAGIAAALREYGMTVEYLRDSPRWSTVLSSMARAILLCLTLIAIARPQMR